MGEVPVQPAMDYNNDGPQRVRVGRLWSAEVELVLADNDVVEDEIDDMLFNDKFVEAGVMRARKERVTKFTDWSAKVDNRRSGRSFYVRDGEPMPPFAPPAAQSAFRESDQ